MVVGGDHGDSGGGDGGCTVMNERVYMCTCMGVRERGSVHVFV